jgi:hypothetical protein
LLLLLLFLSFSAAPTMAAVGLVIRNDRINFSPPLVPPTPVCPLCSEVLNPFFITGHLDGCLKRVPLKDLPNDKRKAVAELVLTAAAYPQATLEEFHRVSRAWHVFIRGAHEANIEDEQRAPVEPLDTAPAKPLDTSSLSGGPPGGPPV